MTFQSTILVRVYWMGGGDRCLMGRLALRDRKIFFEYAAEFIAKKLELSPFKLPLKSGLISSKDPVFDGLFGVFNDSLPDGWGRLLLDRRLIKLGLNPKSFSPLDRLCYVGGGGMGALVYEPETADCSSSCFEDLDQISGEISEFQENGDDLFVEHLLSFAGSSSGARPKIIVRIGKDDWIVKFRSSLDPTDIGPVEYAYHLMAQAAKLDVPDAKLFSSKKGPGYFGVKRFDRFGEGRCHMHTIAGLLHANHHEPSLDYETILKATLWLTKDVRQCEKQFRAAVFNVLSHNRDDHAKNFSFLMDEAGSWSVSPAYDLTFSSGPSGEHCTLVMGEGKNPKLAHLLKLGDVVGIEQPKSLRIIDEVQWAVSRWGAFSKAANVSLRSKKMVQTAIDRVVKR